jgi:hypothetical protein
MSECSGNQGSGLRAGLIEKSLRVKDVLRLTFLLEL